MPTIQTRRKEQILQRLISSVVARTKLSDLTDSASHKRFLSSVAREVDEVYYQLTRHTDLFSIFKAAGDDLDERAKDFPVTIERVGARRAIGTVVFSRFVAGAGTVTIPAGTLVKSSDGQIFKTTQQATITVTSPEQIAGHGVGRDSLPTPAVAEAAGAAGNVAPGTVVKFQAKPTGVDEVTNTQAFVSGRDREDDDDFRARMLAFIDSLARSIVAALEFAAVGIEEEGTGKQVVFSHAFEDIVQRGNVTLFVDDGNGTAETLEAVDPSGDATDVTAPDGNNNQTLTDNGELLFRTDMVPGTITTSGFTNPSNNGTFPIVSVDPLDPSKIVYTNAAGLAESGAPAGQWAIDPELVTRGLTGPPPDSAIGGEEFLRLQKFPIDDDIAITLTSSTRGPLTRGTLTGGEYDLDPSNGRLFFNPPLAAGEQITASYSYFVGLIANVQRVIDGDRNDRLNFPGWRAAGVLVRVRSPTVIVPSVEAVLTIQNGFTRDDVIAAVEAAISNYINNLGISGDVVRNELIERMMAVDGMYDMNLVAPSANQTVLDSEIARIQSSNIDLS